MNNEEIQSLMEQLQAHGLTPEDIADGILWPLFRDGKMSKEDLATLCSAIGLELDPEFAEDEGPEGNMISKEEAEEAKEIKPGESKEEFQEKLEEAKASPETAPEEEPEEEEEDEDAEWEETKKNLFKL